MPKTNKIAGRLDAIAGSWRVPVATYRFQFNSRFTLEQGRQAVAYLRDLGVSHAYASPLFQAGPQSTHGYDICCYQEISSNLGGTAGLDAFASTLRECGLGLILDMVPNHMGNDLSNPWWFDVLEQGPKSSYARYFDIDWQPTHVNLRDRVLLPTLEDHYASVLESGKLQLVFESGGFALAYHDRRFPVAAESYATLLTEVISAIETTSPTCETLANLKGLVESLMHSRRSRTAIREFTKFKTVLHQWQETSELFRNGVEQVLRTYQGVAGQPASFDRLHTLLQNQHYRLAYWKVGPEEINYRRFFDITELVSVRMELPEVFQASHALVFRLLREGKLDGLRIDHPDGLWDPRQYFERLQARYLSDQLSEKNRARKEVADAIADWLKALADRRANGQVRPPDHSLPLYVVAEKILSEGEPLPPNWLVEGTTGYDYLNQANGIFVESQHAAEFSELYARFVPAAPQFKDLVYQSKKRILETSLISEMSALAHGLEEVARETRLGLDFSYRQLYTVLLELIASFPVYRTYIDEHAEQPSEQDSRYIEQTLAGVQTRNPKMDPAVIDFVGRLLRLEMPADFNEEARAQARCWIMKLQQLSGPAMAKGLEDTAFYNYHRLVSLNEVGGNPGEFGVSLEHFHAYNQRTAERWPHTMLATATHDTKRGEDVRARLNVLSEMPEDWAAAVSRWQILNQRWKRLVQGHPAPRPNAEYLLYQTLVGAWPADPETQPGSSNWEAWLPPFRDRVIAFMTKALKEAKARTSWTEPNLDYETGAQEFIAQIVDPEKSAAFLQDIQSFQHRAAFFGQLNSLSQVVLKATAPGMPDFYQGTELWDLSLVDPDNRRPVDYELRHQMLSELKKHDLGADLTARLWNERHTGAVKLYVTWRALQLRQAQRELFAKGDYLPLPTTGPAARHVCAYARRNGAAAVLVVVPRLVFGLLHGKERLPVGPEVWGNTRVELPQQLTGITFSNIFTGETIDTKTGKDPAGAEVAQLLPNFPLGIYSSNQHIENAAR